MATERRDIALSIIADTKRYQTELAKIPGMTDAAAARAAQAAVKQKIKEENDKAKIQRKALADAVRADQRAQRERVQIAERANREIESSYRDQFSSIRGLSGAAFGGMAGDVFDLVEVMSGAGRGLAAIGAGIAALAIAPEIIRGIVEFASGAEDTAEALGHTFTDEQRKRVKQYEIASAALSSEFNSLKLESQLLVAQALTPMIRDLAQIVSAFDNIRDSRIVNYFSDLFEAVGESRQQFDDLLGPVDDVVMAIAKIPEAPLRLLMSFGDAQADFAPMAASVLDATAKVDGLAESGRKLGKVYHDESQTAEEAFTRTAAAVDETAKIEAEALADIEAGRNEQARQDRARYQERIEQSRAAANSAIDEINREIEAERERDLFLAESAERHKQRMHEAHLEEIKLNEEKKRAAAELRDQMLALQTTGLDVAVGFGELAIDKFGETATKAGDRADKLRGEIEQLRDSMTGASEEEREQIEETIAAKEDELAKAEKRQRKANKAARQQFKSNQALQIANTVIAGSAAAIRAFAELGPIAGAVAATAIGADTSLAIAKIKAQKPPKFHTGGMVEPDETPAILRRGEAVLSERATQRLGRRTIEALNRDEPLGAVNIYLGDDLLRSQRLTRAPRGGMHTAIGARSPYLGR